MSILRFLCIGDIIGQPGMFMFQKWAPQLVKTHGVHAVIVNGENAAKNGRGINVKIINFFKQHGAAVITTGNHVWEHKEVYAALDERNDVIRPANYPTGCPGKGYALFTVNNETVAVVNIHGRTFVRDVLDCPFRTIDSLLTFLRTKTKTIIVDFHAEATSEKRAMGLYLDGRISCIFGTHTHVQTADEHLMPKSSAYITDLGGCGALHSVIGMEAEQMISRFLFHPKSGKFVVEQKGPHVLSGILVDVDTATGAATKIERIRVVDENAPAHFTDMAIPT